MDIKELQQHWDSLGRVDPLWAILTQADKRGGRWTIEEFFQEGNKEIASVMEYLRTQNLSTHPKKALDFGCGVGRLSQALAAHCDEVVGVDIAPAMIEQATRLNRHGERCRYVVNSRADLSLFESNSIDFIYSNIVLQHMAPAYSAVYIREFVRLLTPGGVLLFQIPSEPSRTLVGTALRLLPMTVIRLVRKMDMYGTPRAKVEQLIQEAGATVVDVTPDSCAGPHWIGYRYCVVKN